MPSSVVYCPISALELAKKVPSDVVASNHRGSAWARVKLARVLLGRVAGSFAEHSSLCMPLRRTAELSLRLVATPVGDIFSVYVSF